MYVADTHAWIYYLLNKLPAKSNSIFASVERGEDFIVVPLNFEITKFLPSIKNKRIA